MALPCNPVLESCCFLCMFRFLAVQFGPVFGLQLHQFTAMVILYGLDLSYNRSMVLVRGNLTAQILYFIFQAFDFPVAQPTAAFRSSLPFSLFSLERFSLIALSRSSLCRSFSFAFSIRRW